MGHFSCKDCHIVQTEKPFQRQLCNKTEAFQISNKRGIEIGQPWEAALLLIINTSSNRITPPHTPTVKQIGVIMKVQAVALLTLLSSSATATGTRTLKHKHKSSKAANSILPKLTTGQSSCIAGGNRTQDISCIGGNYCVGSCGSRVSADP